MEGKGSRVWKNETWDIMEYQKRIPVEVWGERLYPFVVGTFWLGLPPQHYKNHNHPQSYFVQIPRLASIQKGYPSIQWVSKTTIK